MNKKILENKISELLGVSENEKILAFGIFKKKLSEFLKVGEAIKISNIGVFQLKEKLDHSEDNKFGGKNSRYTLVFSPVVDDPSSDSLFINLEIDQPVNDESAFNENVFQLGIGKSLLTNLDDSTGEDLQAKSPSEKIEDSVASIIEESEKLVGYDLWEDYLERKETKNLLGDQDDSDLTIDAIVNESDDEIANIDLNTSEEDSEFIPTDEDDLLDEIMQESNLLNDDELEKKSDDINIDDIKIPDFDEESADENSEDEQIEEVDEKLDENKIINELESEIIDEIGDDDSKEGSVIEKIDEQIEELESGEKLSLENSIYGDSLDEIEEEEVVSSIEDVSDESSTELSLEDSGSQIIEEANGDEVIGTEEEVIGNEEEDQELEEEKIAVEESERIIEAQEPNKPKRKLLFLLIAAFILIGIISLYFIFFNKPGVVKNETAKEPALVEQTNEESFEESEIQPTHDDNAIVDTPNEVVNDVVKEEKNKIEQALPISEENEKIAGNTNADETEVSENIFYDGFVYNVQVSSWKQESIAEQEVNKLVKRGFPAYKVEVYIAKFKGTWYRVRIGPFPSLVEAQESKQKVNK